LRLLGRPDLLLLSLGYFALNYFEYIFFYWIYYYFGEVKHMPGQTGAIYTTILLLTMMAAAPLGGLLADVLGHRWGVLRSRRVVAGGGMAASALLLYLGVNAHADGLIVFLLSLALGCASAAEGPFWSSAADAGGPDAGAATGVMNGIGNVGGLIAPVLTPYLAERAGWSAGLYFASGVVLVGAGVWIFFRGQRVLR
jgi:MFS family permease